MVGGGSKIGVSSWRKSRCPMRVVEKRCDVTREIGHWQVIQRQAHVDVDGLRAPVMWFTETCAGWRCAELGLCKSGLWRCILSVTVEDFLQHKPWQWMVLTKAVPNTRVLVAGESTRVMEMLLLIFTPCFWEAKGFLNINFLLNILTFILIYALYYP